MEAYIKQQEQPKIRELMEHYSNKALEILTTGGLKDRMWKEFKVGDLFDVSGTITTHPKKLKRGGETPRITCAATNNGLDDTYANTPTEKGGVLTVDSATIGFVSYQEKDFIATDHVEKISFKNGKRMNKWVGLFLKAIIMNATDGKYGYGYKFSQTRIKKQLITLPIDQDENPDWQFMEDFMRKIEQDKVKTILEYYQNMPKCQWGGVNRKVHFDSWQEFEIESLFEIFTGKDLILSNVKEGKIPVVSHKDNENGIHIFSDFIENNIIHNSNTTISLADRGTFKAFIQPANFYVGTRVKALKFKKNVSKEIQKFVITSINKQSELFSYGRNACQRLNKTKILLPTKNNGIDWQGMEEFIKQKELEKIVEVLKYYQE